MNTLVEELEAIDVGFAFKNSKICVLAFADDLVLVSDTDYGMDKPLDEKQLKADAKKCVVFRQILTAKKSNKKTVVVITEPHRWWKGEAIPTMDYEHLLKYLGVRLNPRGEVVIPWEKWEGWLKELKQAPLKPEQKIQIL